ncbi:hypothetical protein M3Y95_01044600 [Aphelenchoides besseyi]|nr:hypothetical protein M3Y95_01044600 [Aphelenchoides besseyi]
MSGCVKVFVLLIVFFASTVLADRCFKNGPYKKSAVLNTTCSGGSVILTVKKKKPLVVDFKPDQLTGGKGQFLNFFFGGCLVKASYGTSPLSFTFDNEILTLPASLTVQADKVVAKGANNKEVDIACTPKTEPDDDNSGRWKIDVKYMAAKPAHAKGFSAIYNAPIFVPQQPRKFYEKDSFWMVFYTVLFGGAFCVGFTIGLIHWWFTRH